MSIFCNASGRADEDLVLVLCKATDTSYNGADHIFSSGGTRVLWKGSSCLPAGARTQSPHSGVVAVPDADVNVVSADLANLTNSMHGPMRWWCLLYIFLSERLCLSYPFPVWFKQASKQASTLACTAARKRASKQRKRQAGRR